MTRFVRSLNVAGLALLALSVTPAVAALFDDTEARRQISVERKRLDDIASRVGAQEKNVEAGLKGINDRIGRLEESMKGQALLDLFREIENLKAEIAKMRGQMEVIANSVEVNQKRQRDFYVDLDTRLRRLEAPPASASPPAGPSPEPPATTGPAGQGATVAAGGAKPPVPPSASVAADPAETRIYENAQNLRRIGNYQGAITAFQEFIRRYPKSALASSAQYWIGDSYFNLRDFRLAIQSQRSLISLYPDSQKVPDALLNIASSQIEMGESLAGRRTMEEVVNKYPVSEAADKAKRRLATLK